MSSSELSALASILASLAVLGGFLWTVYRSRRTQTRRAGRDLIGELERIIDLLKQESKEQKEEIAALRQRNATLLQALSTVYRQPPEVIDWRLNGGLQPPEVRH